MSDEQVSGFGERALGPVSLTAPRSEPRQLDGRHGHLWQWMGEPGSALMNLTVAVRETRVGTATGVEHALNRFVNDVEERLDRVHSIDRNILVAIEDALGASAAVIVGTLGAEQVRVGQVVTTDGIWMHRVDATVTDSEDGAELLGDIMRDIGIHPWVRPA